MTYSTACNTDIHQTLNISLVNKSMDDEDPVCLHNKSIYIDSSVEASCATKASLAEQLTKKLSSAGRKSLAERTIKKQFITYKELKLLVYQINKPRTLQTLLDNHYLQWSINHKSFPDFVKDDMRKNNILAVPSNIYDLSRTIFCSESGIHSLILLKYIVTQCMDIDYSSPFEVLEEEFEDCINVLFNHRPYIDKKESIEKAKCIANLVYLHSIWKQQDPEVWNKLTRQPITQSCVHSSSDTHIFDSPHESNRLNTETNLLCQETETSNGEAIDQPIEIDQSLNEPLITPSSESATAEKIIEPQLLMIDKKQDRDTPTTVPTSKNKRKSARRRQTLTLKHSTYSAKDSLKSPQSSLASSQGSKSEETPSPPENNSSFACLGARPKKTENNTDKASLASKRTIYDNNEFRTMKHTKVKDYHDFCMLLKSCYKKIIIRSERKEAAVLNYIKNPNDQIKLNKAKEALGKGPWFSERYYDLLEKAYNAGKLEYFSDKLNFFIENDYFKSGYSPRDEKSGKVHMKAIPINGSGVHFRYILADGVTPAEAIESCFYNLWFINQEIQFLYSLLVTKFIIYGKKLFNYRFIDDDKTTEKLSMMSFLSSSSIKNKCRILHFLKLIRIVTSTKLTAMPPIKPTADRFYFFENHPNYQHRNLTGDYKIIIALCTVGEPAAPRFIIPGTSEELTIEEIQDKIIEQYNKKPRNETTMSPSSWKELKTYCKYTPSLEIPSITKKSLLSTESGGCINNNNIMDINYENIKKILDIHIAFKKRIKTKHVQRSKKDKQMSIINNQPATIPDRSDATLNKIIKKQPEPEPELEFEFESESKLDLTDELTKYIDDVNVVLRRYNKNPTSENAINAEASFRPLRRLYNKLKSDKVNINNNDQIHFCKIEKQIKTIHDTVNE